MLFLCCEVSTTAVPELALNLVAGDGDEHVVASDNRKQRWFCLLFLVSGITDLNPYRKTTLNVAVSRGGLQSTQLLPTTHAPPADQPAADRAA